MRLRDVKDDQAGVVDEERGRKMSSQRRAAGQGQLGESGGSILWKGQRSKVGVRALNDEIGVGNQGPVRQNQFACQTSVASGQNEQGRGSESIQERRRDSASHGWVRVDGEIVDQPSSKLWSDHARAVGEASEVVRRNIDAHNRCGEETNAVQSDSTRQIVAIQCALEDRGRTIPKLEKGRGNVARQ